MNDVWTSPAVADRLREAADTLRRLPNIHPGRHMTSSWPDIVRTMAELRHFSDPAPARIAPSPSAIDRMDEDFQLWLPRLEAGEVRILWSWMARIPAAALARKLGVSRATVTRRQGAALKKLAVLLNSAKISLVFAEKQ